MDILLPMFSMIVLTAGVSALLLGSRLPSIIRHFGHLQGAMHSDELRPRLSPRMRFITDNYNHLFEQPTLFYAALVYIHLMSHTDGLHVQLAWAYVGLRIIHTIIHLTNNNVSWRAVVFGLSSACLVVMIAREGLALL